MIDLEKLMALEAAATPGPWEFRDGHSREGDSIEILMAEVGKAGEGEEPEYAYVFDDTVHREREVLANWELICEVRNALPEILARLKEEK